MIVTITEDDLHEQQHKIGSLSNQALARLLDKLAQFQAGTIGLDIYRDEPVQANQAYLTTRWKNDDNFFAICKASDHTKNYRGILPPPGVSPARLGFSDVVQDPDGFLRRHLLAMNPAPASPCSTPHALSAQLAFHYLEKEGISAKYVNGELQVGKVVLQRLRSPMSGYQTVDTDGSPPTNSLAIISTLYAASIHLFQTLHTHLKQYLIELQPVTKQDKPKTNDMIT